MKIVSFARRAGAVVVGSAVLASASIAGCTV